MNAWNCKIADINHAMAKQSKDYIPVINEFLIFLIMKCFNWNFKSTEKLLEKNWERILKIVWRNEIEIAIKTFQFVVCPRSAKSYDRMVTSPDSDH